jgi:hypothetical protein
MSKSKHAKPAEFEREQIRNLKKQLKQAHQTIRSLEKELGYQQNRTEKHKRREEIVEKPDCPECSKGYLKELDLVGRIFDTCTLCGYRSKIKKAMKRKN